MQQPVPYVGTPATKRTEAISRLGKIASTLGGFLLALSPFLPHPDQQKLAAAGAAFLLALGSYLGNAGSVSAKASGNAAVDRLAGAVVNHLPISKEAAQAITVAVRKK